jgi:hypothetical protein
MLPLARRAIKPIKCAGSRLILENVSSQCPHPSWHDDRLLGGDLCIATGIGPLVSGPEYRSRDRKVMRGRSKHSRSC